MKVYCNINSEVIFNYYSLYLFKLYFRNLQKLKKVVTGTKQNFTFNFAN